MQKVRHSSVDALYFQSGNTITEIGAFSDDVERLLESNIDGLEKDIQIIQASLTRLKKRIKEKKESV
jgi:archaellum component FlaC